MKQLNIIFGRSFSNFVRLVVYMIVISSCRYSTLAFNVGTAGPDVLKSHVIPPLFNQTYPGCWLGSQFYMVGDRWNPLISPHGLMVCVKCQCAQVVKRHRVQLEGKVVCTNIKRHCPKPKCASPILRPNTCCKICPGQDTSFEDQFNTVGSPTQSYPAEDDNIAPEKDMSALLVGGGRQKHGARVVRTRAVAMVHLTNITEDSFNFAVRYSRLKDPVYFKITDEYGSPVIERKLQRQTSRSDVIYDKIEGIPKNYIKYILQNTAYVTLTTSRYRRGEIRGLLRTNTIAAIASFEALLNPPDKSGIGALVTMFYDVTTKMASYVIQVDGYRHSKMVTEEYFVTFEKDTEIIHQHVLRISNQKYQMVGKVSVDSKMSKQIARGRLHVRVTSRTGETMIGLLRPRLLRTGMIATFSSANHGTGYLLMSLDDNGSLKYKVSLNLPHTDSISVSVQRNIKSSVDWRDFAVIIERIDTYNEPRFQKAGLFKKLRARDIILIQNTAVRAKLTINDEEIIAKFHQLNSDTEFLFKASDMMLRSAYCETPAFVFYEVSNNCSSLDYYVIASGARENNLDMTLTIETKNAGVFVRKLDESYVDSPGLIVDKNSEDSIPREQSNQAIASLSARNVLVVEKGTMYVVAYSPQVPGLDGRPDKTYTEPLGTISEIEAGVFRDINHGKAVANLRVSDDVCEHYEGQVQVINSCWVKHSPEATTTTTDSRGNGLEIDGFDNFRCYYEGQFYAHAQSWIPADDNPCVTCRCNRGNVHCDRLICPPTSCKYPIRREGECCPVCNDDNDTEKKHSGSCYFEGDKRWHPAGSYWHPFVPPFGYSKCAICTCMHSTLEVNCTRVPCPELKCPKPQQVRVNTDDCCQVCRGINAVSTGFEDMFLKKRTKGKEACTFGDGIYQHGDKWHPSLHPFGEMKCYTCSCKNGKARCRKQRCQPLDCKHQYRRSGDCCPVCAEKRSKSRKRGSNEIIT